MIARKLIVKTNEQIAELWEDGSLFKVYQVSTAKNGLGCIEGSNCTPVGKLRVAEKIGDNCL